MKRGRPKGRSRDSRSFGPLGDLIRKSRLEKQLGLLDVAKHLDCSVQFISNIEHGRAPLPWEKSEALAQFLGLTLEQVQAANLSVRSDFKSFVGTGGNARSAGISKGKTLLKRSGGSLASGVSQDPALFAQTAAVAAKDAGLRSLISAYQAASLSSRKKFVKVALKMLKEV